LWFCANLCEWLNACHSSYSHPETSTHPSTPPKCCEWRNVLQLLTLLMFHFKLTFAFVKEPGSVSQKAFIFLSWLLFFIKKINDFAKNVNIFHFNSNGNRRLSYFLIATTLWHTSHYHNQPIACNRILTWKNATNLL
jgi:hypothetical protein